LKNTTNGRHILSHYLDKSGKCHEKLDIDEFICEIFYGSEADLKALILSCEWKLEFFV
jgi:hypothetical protein